MSDPETEYISAAESEGSVDRIKEDLMKKLRMQYQSMIRFFTFDALLFNTLVLDIYYCYLSEGTFVLYLMSFLCDPCRFQFVLQKSIPIQSHGACMGATN